MIELKGVSKIFHEGGPDAWVALDGVDLTVEPRSVTVLRGPSGSGKTTLLSILGGMARPTSGRVAVDGREITSLPERFLTALRRERFGFVFQHGYLVRGLTALENVMLPAYPLGECRAALERRALGLLERSSLSSRVQEKVERLSGGEAQRVAIARALVNGPQVIFADEPTAHLDSRLSRAFMEIVAELKSEQKTVIIASHDPIVCEARAIDRVVSMRDGRVEVGG